MSNSHTHAASLFGYHLRITYVAVLAVLFLARMCSVHGVHAFLGLDAGHGEMASIAGRLPGLSAEVAHAAFVRLYAPQTAGDGIVDRTIGNWVAQHAKVAQFLGRACAGDDALCVHFHALDTQMLTVAASARAAAQRRSPIAARRLAGSRRCRTTT